MKAKKLKASDLRWFCSSADLSFYKNPKTFQGADYAVGQDRAIAALETGLSISRSGYNIYVAGMVGSGRSTTIRRTLEHLKPDCRSPQDRCYVYNFAEANQPILLSFPQGEGRHFRDDMKNLIRVLRADIPKALEATHVIKEKELLLERYQREEKKMFEEFAERLKQEKFALIQVQDGNFIAPAVFPLIGKEAVPPDRLEIYVKEGKLSSKQREKLISQYRKFSSELKTVLAKARSLGKEMNEHLDHLTQRTGAFVLDGLIDDLKSRYQDEKVRKYLFRVKSHILKNLDHFSAKEEKPQEGMMMFAPSMAFQAEDPFWVYEVNVLNVDTVEKSTQKTCLIVEENNPTFTNLFGAIEYNNTPGGGFTTDFRRIRAGSLLKADGGYLIVHALDVLRKPYVWDHFKRVLKTETLIIQQPEILSPFVPVALKPEPIEISVKVLLIGPSWLYHLLWEHEDEFEKIFKILADFETSMPKNKTSLKEFAAVLKAVCDRGKLLLPDKSGMAALLEYGVKESGQRDRLSTRFTYITDVLREANHIAEQKKSKSISKAHVDEALRLKHYRHSRVEEYIQRAIDEEVIMIDTSSKKVGQINGLAVYSLANASFGKPSRVTVSTSLGRAGIVNIERESHLSGPTHDKGVHILTGYIRHCFGQGFPLSFSASVAFEQSYGGIDGDSASSTEVYALLSSFSGLPISQGIAVTGSVNQMGEIQAIGGVNEKIEGYFDVCKKGGLTGKQGVIIPWQNERHLMLKDEVLEAVKKGKFQIYSVRTIEEGIEVLTGVTAGKRVKNGSYPSHSVFGKAEKKLREMALNYIRFGAEEHAELEELAKERVHKQEEKIEEKEKN